MNPKHYIGKVCLVHPELGGLRLRSQFKCTICHQIKTASYIAKRYREDPDFREAKIQAAILRKRSRAKRVPPWADRGAIYRIYQEARRLGMTVDHFYPLNGVTVSGLHVETNLRIISQQENDSKGNKFPIKEQ